MEAEKAECATADLSVEVTIKRRGTGEIGATSVVPADEEAVAEKELAQKQTALKLLSVKSRIINLKRAFPFQIESIRRLLLLENNSDRRQSRRK